MLQRNLLLFIFSYLFNLSLINGAVFNRYLPGSTFGTNPHRVYIDKGAYKKANLLASYGLTKNMCDTAEKGIISHYSGIVMNSGIECNEIAMEMEDKFGGFWMVAIFDGDFDIAYTISRRSRSYGVFAIDDRLILVARDGGILRHRGPV